MPRRSRLETVGLAYHVLDRRVGRLPLFETRADYFAFETIIHEVHDREHKRLPTPFLAPSFFDRILNFI